MKNSLVLISFLDLTLNLILILAVMVLLSTHNTNPGNVDAPGEFLITVEWSGDINADIDTWVKAPDGSIVSFGSPNWPLLFLDRDDLGSSTDSYYDNNGNVVTLPLNREVVTIKGIYPGEYIVNLHYYREFDYGAQVPVRVELTKLNPYSEIITREVILDHYGQEETAFRFIVGNDGKVEDTSFIPYPLVYSPR